ncbi:MAG: HD domain-containing protein [bacterium]|nr:HD domain-containing protein [bacterium]
MHDEPSHGEPGHGEPGHGNRDAQPRRRRPGLRVALTVLAAGPVAVSLAVVLLVDESQRLVAAAVVLVLSALLAHRLAGRLLQPLASLRESLERLGRGEFGRPLTVLDDNEFGQLADQVNELARHLKKSRKRTEAREQAMINTLGQVAEGRSSESVNHMHRVGAMSGELARLAGLPDDEAELLRLAAPLHDLGKVGVPDVILSKPGKYTPREFAAMKSHAELGHRILSGSKLPVMRVAALVALTHHERWDGHGYPRALSGEEIPIQGRIVGLIDTFDAIFSDRPYRKAMSVETGLGIIRSQRGHHFDPRLIDIFLENLPVFLAIVEQYRDQAPAGTPTEVVEPSLA